MNISDVIQACSYVYNLNGYQSLFSRGSLSESLPKPLKSNQRSLWIGLEFAGAKKDVIAIKMSYVIWVNYFLRFTAGIYNYGLVLLNKF